MAAPMTTIWSMDDHTRAKHEILRRYLQAWLPIMTNRNEHVVIIDGFAGPGEYIGGESGSPLIAVDTFLNHTYAQIREKKVTFLFIEEDARRCEYLERLLEIRKQEHLFPQQATYQVIQSTFDETMTGLLTSLEEQGLRIAPTFAFIDPFGYSDTPMTIISRLMRYYGCEVLITFMYEEINRFLTADYRTKEQQYDTLFGTQAWRQIATTSTDNKDRMRRLHDLYRDQLRTVGGAKYVRSFRMLNKHNTTDYFLFFGTNHPSGLRAMKDAMWAVDQSGTYQFSDFTDQKQLLLFQPEPDYSLLKRMLLTRFEGETVSIEEIDSFVLEETPFRVTGYKEKVLVPMEDASEIKIIASGMKRRRHTYPEGIRIHFGQGPQVSLWG